MWQRVQTLYLFISTALMVTMIFSDKTEGVRYTAYLPYLILLVVIGLLDLLALTTYRFRVFQMRTAVLSALVTVALQGWLALDFFVAGKDLVWKMTAVFPIVSVILNVLAAAAIWRDEMIVRTSSRLRAAKRKETSKK